KNIPLTKEEEEGITAEVEEVHDEEIFQRTLAAKLWTDNSFKRWIRKKLIEMVGS
ncbi:hypothetical protein A2U01_0112990, partial [Trifolium medium]|nr:hypothetical protein [Trifolium medium]